MLHSWKKCISKCFDILLCRGPNLKCYVLLLESLSIFYLTSIKFHLMWETVNWCVIFNKLHTQPNFSPQRVKMIFLFHHIPTISKSPTFKDSPESSLLPRHCQPAPLGCLCPHSHSHVPQFPCTHFIKLHFKRYKKFLEPPLKYSAKARNSMFSSMEYYKNDSKQSTNTLI